MSVVESRKGPFIALLAFLVYSTHDSIVKYLGDYSVFQIVFFAMLFGYVPFTIARIVDTQPKTLKPNNILLVSMRTFCAVGSLIFAFTAFTVLPLVQAYVLLFVTPMIISVLSVIFLNEKIHFFRWFAIGLGLVGVIIVLRPSLDNFHWGQLAGLAAAFCNAGVATLSRKIGHTENASTLIVFPLMANIALSGIALIFVYQPMPLIDLSLMFLVGCLGLYGQMLIIASYRLSAAAVIAPMQYSQLIWAALFGYFIFNEGIDTFTVIGSLVVIISGVLIIWREVTASNTKPNLSVKNIRFVAATMLRSKEYDDD